MDEVTCDACRATNPASASFCNRCGAALRVATPAGSDAGTAPSGWAMATAGIERPAPASGELTKRDSASWGARFGAWLLDWLILVVLVCAFWALSAWVVTLVEPDASQRAWDSFTGGIESATNLQADGTYYEDDPFANVDPEAWATIEPYVIGAALLGWLLTLVWDIAWVASKARGKPGQLAAGFRVVRADDLRRAGVGRSIGRTLAKLLYSVPYAGFLVLVASAFTIGMSEKRQSLHDMIAGTRCVKRSVLETRERSAQASTGPFS